jgi:putative membrane protein
MIACEMSSMMMMWPMGIGSLVIVGVVLALAWWAVRRAAGGPTDARPMQLLDERFARGEIDAEEYQGRRQVLEGAR